MANNDLLSNPMLQRLPQTQQEFTHWINELAKFINPIAEFVNLQVEVATIELEVDNIEAGVDTAAETSVSITHSPGKNITIQSLPDGTFPAGDPEYDITVTFTSSSGEVLATRELVATLTSATGALSITSDTNFTDSPGYTTSYTQSSDGQPFLTASITLNLPDNSMLTTEVSWNALDASVGGVNITF